MPRTMYTVTMAAWIRVSSFAEEDSKARAVPWKLVSTLAGIPRSCATCLICWTALPSDAPGDKLKERVTTGNWLWWLIVIGEGMFETFTSSLRGAGTMAAAPVRAALVPANAMVDARLAEAAPVGTYMSLRPDTSC